MLNQEINIFKNLDVWNKNKHSTLFKNNFDLQNYQNYFLKKLLKNKQKHETKFETIQLMSSGTTSNIRKYYKFPSILYETIENHHIWRIMNSHEIESGNVVKIFQGLLPYSKNKLEGPITVSSMGLMNYTWQVIFNPLEIDKNFWKEIFINIKKIKPKFLYTSPSVFESFYREINDNFNFPIIFSCEILTEALRKESNLIFKKSIDKMRDWTTGFGFFECPYGTKHIYDELCLVKQLQENKIISTDLFNYCEFFIDKTSDDVGDIKQKFCNCGIYGNYLYEFQGKTFECLVSIKGKKYSSNFVSNVFYLLPFDLGQYEILQTKQKNIEFRTKRAISDFEATEIAITLNKLIGDLDENFSFSVFNNNKILFLSNSNSYIKFIVGDSKIYKNKKISVRSQVAE